MILDTFFRSFVRKGDTVLDIGAFRGSISRLFSGLVGDEGSVHSFEAHPVHFAFLAAEAAREAPGFGRIYPRLRAVGEGPGHVILYSAAINNSRDEQASTIVESLANKERLGEGIIQFRLEKGQIDQICGEADIRPTFIKVDVEGAENLVFRGAAKTIERNQPLVVFEFGWEPGVRPLEHHRLLESLGYKLFIIDVMHYRGKWIAAGNPAEAATLFPFFTEELNQITAFLGNVAAVPPRLQREAWCQGAACPIGLSELLKNPHFFV